MKTLIKKNGDALVVTLDGHLDFETYIPLRENLNNPAKQVKNDTIPKKIIFDFENLEFVGSSGISSFIQILKEFNEFSPMKPRYCNVRSEFQKIIKAYDQEELFDFYDNEERAKKSFDQ